MKVYLLFIVLSVMGMSCSANHSIDQKDMELKEITVKTTNGNIVMVGKLMNDKLEGQCIWYNGAGVEVSKGDFKDGKPFNGTFIDWSLHFNELEKGSYNSTEYCKDWVTIFEASFLSKKIDYSHLIVVFKEGKRINTESTISKEAKEMLESLNYWRAAGGDSDHPVDSLKSTGESQSRFLDLKEKLAKTGYQIEWNGDEYEFVTK